MDATEVLQSVIDLYLAAYEAHDAAACAALYADDGVVISPFGPPAIGRDAIRDAHEAWFLDGETNKVMTVIRAGIDGKTGHCLVAFSADVPGDAGPERFHGASLNTLARTNDRWLMTHSSLNELDSDLTGLMP